jgi:hypothetical protein
MPLFVNSNERQPLRKVKRAEDPLRKPDERGLNQLQSRSKIQKLSLNILQDFQRVSCLYILINNEHRGIFHRQSASKMRKTDFGRPSTSDSFGTKDLRSG